VLIAGFNRTSAINRDAAKNEVFFDALVASDGRDVAPAQRRGHEHRSPFSKPTAH
jgi:hypothetical protein